MSKFVHMELNTSDPEAATKFYKSVFGWKSQKMKMADGSVYIMIMTAEGEGIGGIQKNPMPEGPSTWLGYIGVDSVKRTIGKVEKRGGKVLVPTMEIPGMGSLAIFLDPQGAMFAAWQPAKKVAAPEVGQAAPAEAAPAKKASKKAPAKKASAKKAPAKKAPAKKASAKKASAKKAPAKKASAKKPAKKAAKK